MPNLFDGLNAMTDDEIRMQIAMIGNVTLANAAKETGLKVLSGLTEFANAVTEAFSKKAPFEFQVMKVSDVVNDAQLRMRGKEREQLEYELKKLLIEKCNALTTVALGDDASNDLISNTIATEASKAYNIEKYKSFANKLERTSIEYNSAFLDALHGMLVKQNEQEVKKSDQLLQKRLNEVSLEVKRQLQQKLLPKEFSGRGIGRILRLEKSTKYLEYTISYLGMESFDYVQADITAVLTALRNLKRLDRMLLASFVWHARTAYGRKFPIGEDVLPSYIPENEKEASTEKEKEFRMLMKERLAAEEIFSKCNKALEKQETLIQSAKDRLELESREYDEVQMKFMGLQSRKDEFITGMHDDSSTKSYYNEVNETKRSLDHSESNYNKSKDKLHELVAEKKSMESERNTAMLNLEVVKHKTKDEVDAISDRIKRLWQAYFYKFHFEPDIYDHIAVEFTNAEILSLEVFLKEMHDSDDFKAFSSKSDETSLYAYCYVSTGKNAVITYEDNHILSIARLR
jgi:hypothetical protein